MHSARERGHLLLVPMWEKGQYRIIKWPPQDYGESGRLRITYWQNRITQVISNCFRIIMSKWQGQKEHSHNFAKSGVKKPVIKTLRLNSLSNSNSQQRSSLMFGCVCALCIHTVNDGSLGKPASFSDVAVMIFLICLCCSVYQCKERNGRCMIAHDEFCLFCFVSLFSLVFVA